MTHLLSLQLSDDLFEDAELIARRRGLSFDAFVEELLRTEIAAKQEREMYEAASLLGTDPESNVEFAQAAQSEVALRKETLS